MCICVINLYYTGCDIWYWFNHKFLISFCYCFRKNYLISSKSSMSNFFPPRLSVHMNYFCSDKAFWDPVILFMFNGGFVLYLLSCINFRFFLHSLCYLIFLNILDSGYLSKCTEYVKRIAQLTMLLFWSPPPRPPISNVLIFLHF